MRRKLAGSLAVMLCASATNAATLISWNGVEVITNDFNSVSRIREIAGLAPGTVLDVADPKLQAVCDGIRKEFSSSEVSCTSVIGPRVAPDGPPTAWYIVEVNIEDREPRICPTGESLPEDLMWVYNSWQATLGDAMLTGVPVRERVNDKKYLDYDHTELSRVAATIHAAIQGREVELASAASSCEPTLRMTGFYLMNFAGDPQRFIQLAGAHINDWHVGAANAATRFLITFADYIPATEVPRLAGEACRSMREGGFTARNKSLMLLSAWRKRKELSFEQLAPDCQRQIRDIARTSLSEQIAVPARELVGQSAR